MRNSFRFSLLAFAAALSTTAFASDISYNNVNLGFGAAEDNDAYGISLEKELTKNVFGGLRYSSFEDKDNSSISGSEKGVFVGYNRTLSELDNVDLTAVVGYNKVEGDAVGSADYEFGSTYGELGVRTLFPEDSLELSGSLGYLSSSSYKTLGVSKSFPADSSTGYLKAGALLHLSPEFAVGVNYTHYADGDALLLTTNDSANAWNAFLQVKF